MVEDAGLEEAVAELQQDATDGEGDRVRVLVHQHPRIERLVPPVVHRYRDFDAPAVGGRIRRYPLRIPKIFGQIHVQRASTDVPHKVDAQLSRHPERVYPRG